MGARVVKENYLSGYHGYESRLLILDGTFNPEGSHSARTYNHIIES